MTDWVRVLSDFIVAGSASLAAFCAWRGLKTWREEGVWKRNQEVTKTLLVALHRFKTETESFRFYAVFPDEGTLSEKSGHMTDQEQHAVRLRNAYQGRFEKLKESVEFLNEARVEGWAAWGDDLNKAILPLLELNERLVKAVRNYLIQVDPNAPEELLRAVERDPDSNLDFVWDTMAPEDAYRSEFDPLYSAAIQFLRTKQCRV